MRLFEDLDAATRVGPGIRRDSYGEGENAAHVIVAEAARDLGLDVTTDAGLNLFMTLPGRDRDRPAIVIGSHLDSVDNGGNFDGAAGVLAGLAIVAGYRDAGRTPGCDIKVAALRCEEAHWFDGPYVGANIALGKLDAMYLDGLRRSDTGRTLADHLREHGGDPDAIRGGAAHLDPDRIAAYLELHIEQAPVLVERDLPVGLVTGIRGYRRYANATCRGAYGHSGALPRIYRHDAVAATVDVIARLREEWRRIEDEGGDLVFTVGRIATDPDHDGPSKVPGAVDFSIDIRSTDTAVLTRMDDLLHAAIDEAAAGHGVTFDLGERSANPPAAMDADLLAKMTRAADDAGIGTMEIASGAGHDAAAFATGGVPTAMIFIRNRHGSHNPDEHMEMADFGEAVRLAAGLVAELTV